MNEKTYTLLDLAEDFGKDKQLIRRRISRLKIESINKETRKYYNNPLIYNHEAYLELAKDFGISKSNTHDTQQYTKNLSGDKLIEVLERELKHSKDRLEKAEKEKESLYKLLSQQQQLSLNDKNKIKILELEIEEVKELGSEEELKKEEKTKWYDFFKRTR